MGRSHRRRTPLITVFGASLVAALITSQGASAHAELRSVTPAAHAVVAEAPRFAASYGEAVGAGRPDVVLTGPSGFVWRAPFPTFDKGVIALGLPTLRPGSYVVTWATAAEDGHVQPSATTFAVGAPTSVRIVSSGASSPTAAITTTTAVRKPAKTTKAAAKGAKTAKAPTAPSTTVTTSPRLAAVDLVARTDAGSAAATLRSQVQADGRIALSVTLAAGTTAPDSWTLSASSTATDGGWVPIAVRVASGGRTATAEPVILPPGTWTVRLLLTRGFEGEDASTTLGVIAT